MSMGDKILEGVVKEMIIFGQEIPYGYRDVELEDRLMKNTFRKQGLEQGLKEGLKEGKEIGLELGIQQGMKQGIEQANMATARNLLNMGMKPSEIAKATGLSLAEIDKIKQ